VDPVPDPDPEDISRAADKRIKYTTSQINLLWLGKGACIEEVRNSCRILHRKLKRKLHMWENNIKIRTNETP
jgi:hypothetical protein